MARLPLVGTVPYLLRFGPLGLFINRDLHSSQQRSYRQKAPEFRDLNYKFT